MITSLCRICFALAMVTAISKTAASQEYESSLDALLARKDTLEGHLRAIADSIEVMRSRIATDTDTVFVGTAGDLADLIELTGYRFDIVGKETQYRILGVEQPSGLYSQPYWEVRHSDGHLYFIADEDIQVSRKEAAIAYFRDRPASKSPLLVFGARRGYFERGGAVQVRIAFRNADDRRTIKYIHVNLTPYNGVGDVAQTGLGREQSVRLTITGPYGPQGGLELYSWPDFWHNTTIRCLRITRVDVEYTDGSTYAYVRELPRVLHPMVRNTCTPL